MNRKIDSSQIISLILMKKKFTFIALFIFVGLFLFLLISQQKAPEKNEDVLSLSVKDYLLSNFLAELPDINKKLPYAIDNNTMLKFIEYKDGKVIQSYELIKYKKINDSEEKFFQSLIPALKKQACIDPIRQKMLAAGIEFSSIYSDTTGQVVFEITFNESSCSEINPTSQKS